MIKTIGGISHTIPYTGKETRILRDLKTTYKMKTVRSKVWKYYDKVDHNTAQCQLCERIIKTSGNTSNLMKHMKTHPQIDVNDQEFIVQRGIFKRESPEYGNKRRYHKSPPRQRCKIEPIAIKHELSEAAVNLLQGDDDDVDALHEAHVAVESVVLNEGVDQSDADGNVEAIASWTGETESAATVTADDIIEFEPSVVDDQIESVYHLQELPIGDTDEDDNPYNPSLDNGYVPMHLDNLAYFLCRDKQPLDIVKGEGFKHLMRTICPTYKLPSVEQLGARVDQLAEQQLTTLRQEFNNIATLAISAAVTTSLEDRQNFIELVVHYHEGKSRRSRMLSVLPLPLHYNAEHIIECLERCFQRFEIEKTKVSCVVTKNNRILQNAVSGLLGTQKYVPCLADILETAFNVIVQRMEFCVLCDKVRHYVKEYLISNVNEQPDLLLDVKHRSISSYDMLERYVKYAPHMQKSLASSLTPHEIELIKQLLIVLKPLACAVRELCRPGTSTYPCISKALPIVYTIVNELKQARGVEHKFTYELRMFLIKHLEERFESMEKNVYMAMGCLLDPRFRKVPFQSSTLVAKYMSKLCEKLQQFESNPVKRAVDTDDYNIWTAYKTLSHEKHKHSILSSDSDDEVSTYFCNNISSLSVEPMVLWEDLSQFHPFLYSLAKRYLHIPASAIAPATIFTEAGKDVLDHRSKLLGDHMNSILFLADCTNEEWQL